MKLIMSPLCSGGRWWWQFIRKWMPIDLQLGIWSWSFFTLNYSPESTTHTLIKSYLRGALWSLVVRLRTIYPISMSIYNHVIVLRRQFMRHGRRNGSFIGVITSGRNTYLCLSTIPIQVTFLYDFFVCFQMYKWCEISFIFIWLLINDKMFLCMQL